MRVPKHVARKVRNLAIAHEAAKDKPLEPLVTYEARCTCGRKLTKLIPREWASEMGAFWVEDPNMAVSVSGCLLLEQRAPEHFRPECKTKLFRTDEDGSAMPEVFDYQPIKQKGKTYGRSSEEK